MYSCEYRITMVTKFAQHNFQEEQKIHQVVESVLDDLGYSYSDLQVQSTLIGFNIHLSPSDSVTNHMRKVKKNLTETLSANFDLKTPIFAKSFLCTTVGNGSAIDVGIFVSEIKRSYRDKQGSLT